MLDTDCRAQRMTWVRTSRRPFVVASTMPTMASTTAMTTSSLLLAGILKPLPPPWPAQAKNTNSSTRCTMAPAATLSPTPVTASAGSTPAFCMNRTFSAMPPTLAGVTRLTNDDASCASTLGTNGRCSGTPPAMPIADGDVGQQRQHDGTRRASPSSPMRSARKLSPTLASCGSRT